MLVRFLHIAAYSTVQFSAVLLLLSRHGQDWTALDNHCQSWLTTDEVRGNASWQCWLSWRIVEAN
jgi:hypothetical protein